MSPKKIILFALLLLAVLGLIEAYRLWQDRFGVPEDEDLVTRIISSTARSAQTI